MYGKSRDWLVRTLNILVDKSIPAKVKGQEWVIYFSRKKEERLTFLFFSSYRSCPRADVSPASG